jgi:hypothetical protein
VPSFLPHSCLFFCLQAVELGFTVRRLQEKCKLSQLQTNCVVQEFKRNGLGKSNLRQADKERLAEAGLSYVVLHGCTKVHDNGEHCQHIYVPEDKRETCPKCGLPRFDPTTKQPNEKVYWFPLRPRFEAWLKIPSFRQLLQVFTHVFAVVFVCLFKSEISIFELTMFRNFLHTLHRTQN